MDHTMKVQALREALGLVLRGKEAVAETVLCALLSSGHVLFEDVPGVGKTTLIKFVSRWLGVEFSRIQCTSDLLPSDILGVEVYNQTNESFVYHKGPLFSPIVFVDELNRASPRTQSALLEAMAEGFVTVNRRAYELPKPFLVFATQNPSESIGTYPLPESQLDRFSARVKLQYPIDSVERDILRVATLNPMATTPTQILSLAELMSVQQQVDAIHVGDRVVDVAKQILDASRSQEGLKLGISTRGGVLWLRMARARAYLMRRDHVIPDDLLALAPSCLGHRLLSRAGRDASPVLDSLLSSVRID